MAFKKKTKIIEEKTKAEEAQQTKEEPPSASAEKPPVEEKQSEQAKELPPPPPPVEQKAPEASKPVEALKAAPLPVAKKVGEPNLEFKSAESSLIQCRILSAVNAVIGKKRYTFAAGTIAKVPGSVYEILKQARKAI